MLALSRVVLPYISNPREQDHYLPEVALNLNYTTWTVIHILLLKVF